MKAVIQRVRSASVQVDSLPYASIGPGAVVLVSVERGDGASEAQWMAGKLRHMRIFASGGKNFELDVVQSTGELLLVSNFTISADLRKGRRPDLIQAASPEHAEPVFNQLVDFLRKLDVRVATGKFRADMVVHILNDGPVTFCLQSEPPSPDCSTP